MKTIILTMIMLFVAAFTYADGVPSINVIPKATISIDGELSDWNVYYPSAIPIKQHNESYIQDEKWDGDSDFSGSFISLADDDFIYFGFNIIDDKLVFNGTNQYSMPKYPYIYDCVELFLYGKDRLNPLHIFVTLFNNKCILFGQDYISKYILPNYYSNDGLVSNLYIHNNGYSVEIAIPTDFLRGIGWNKWEPLGINIGLYDNDSKKYEAILELSKIWGNSISMFNFVNKYNQNFSVDDKTINIQEINIEISDNNHNVDSEALYEVGYVYETYELFEQAKADYVNAMVASISGDVYNKAKLGLARIYFYENNLLKAKTITKEVLESCTDNVKFFAKTLLMSIEMKE